ncbi:MAG: Gfo/Idh/MocA family oxidoreductase [Hyphomicrobiales bacterium]
MSLSLSHQIAIVGVGKIAVDQHIPSISENPEFELAATVSRNGKVDGVEAFTDLTKMLEQRPDVTAVSLCMPPQFRYEYAVEAMRAGRHVLLEKPPGATISEVDNLQKIADEVGVSLFATWHSRFAYAVEEARKALAATKLKSISVVWKEDVRKWHPGQAWIWEAGGLGVFDPGINALSILTEIMPHPLHLSNASLEFPANRDTPIAAHLNFRDHLNSDISAVFDWRQEGPQSWNIIAETDAGSYKLIEGGSKLLLADEVISSGPEKEYPNIYKRFAELLRQGTSDVDVSPLKHVADAFMLGKRVEVDPFHD